MTKQLFTGLFPHFSDLYADMQNGFNGEEFKAKVEAERKHQYALITDKSFLEDKAVTIELDTFTHIPQGRFSMEVDDFHYECCFIPNKNSKKLMVVLGGAKLPVSRLPQCQMYTRALQLNVNYLYIEDPMYYRYPKPPYLLTWYFESEQEIIRKRVAELIYKISSILSVDGEDVFFVTFSGGGTAAIAVQSYLESLYGMRGGVIAQNPQINCAKSGVNQFFTEQVGIDLEHLSQKGEANDLCGKMKSLTSSNFVILINLNSKRDHKHLAYLVEYFHIQPKLGLNMVAPNIILLLYYAKHHGDPHGTFLTPPLLHFPIWILDCLKKKVDLTQVDELFLYFTELYYRDWDLQTTIVKRSPSTIKALLSTIRVDIKNFSETNPNNDIELIIPTSFQKTKVQQPQWFQNHGVGYVIHSTDSRLKMMVKCLHDGELQIALRTKDIRDAEMKRIHYFVDIADFKVDGREIVSQEIINSASHDKPINHSLSVTAGQVLEIELAWHARRYSPAEYAALFNRMGFNKK